MNIRIIGVTFAVAALFAGCVQPAVAQSANRMLLREIMTSNGFMPINEEWWYFTLADEPYPDTYFDLPVM